MINLHNAESLVTIICLLCAYLFSVTLTGTGQALVAHKMGDDTAADQGLLSLNPLEHLDAIGLMLIVLLGFGWGRQIPIDPHNIHNPHRGFKLFLVYCTEALLSILIAIISLIILVFAFGTYPLAFALQMFFSGNVPMKTFTTVFPEASSLAIVGALILLAFVFFNVFIASLSLILNGFRYAMVIGHDRGYNYMRYADYLTFLAPLLVLFFFADPLRSLLMHLIMYSAYGIAYILGAC